jgi:hypothetical protein
LTAIALAGVVCAVRFTPIVTRMVGTGDFPTHTGLARQIVDDRFLPIPHFGYHLFVILVQGAWPGVLWPDAAALVTIGGLVVTAMLLARWISMATTGLAGLTLTLAVLLPVAIMTVQPVFPFGSGALERYLIGYFPANQLHNPTMLFSKPLALALFPFGLKAAFERDRQSWRLVAMVVPLVVLSMVIKPSFMMAFMPAVTGLAILNARRADWKLLLFGLALPTVIVLLPQYIQRYQTEAAAHPGVIWAPLYVIGLHVSTDPVTLAARLAASVVFPAFATLLFFTAAVRDRALGMAWAVFVAGIALGYLFAESGASADHGNFLWSGQLAAFLLFAVSSLFVLRFTVVGLALLWHVWSGVRHLQMNWLD